MQSLLQMPNIIIKIKAKAACYLRCKECAEDTTLQKNNDCHCVMAYCSYAYEALLRFWWY